jgi:hypothetical protein
MLLAHVGELRERKEGVHRPPLQPVGIHDRIFVVDIKGPTVLITISVLYRWFGSSLDASDGSSRNPFI